MIISTSVCIAVVVCLATFKESRTNLTPITFLLGAVLLAELSYSFGALPTLSIGGPGMVPMIGAAMLFMLAASTKTKVFTVLQRLPASAYKAVAPAVISMLVLTLLGLALIL